MSSPHNMAVVMQQKRHLDFETDRQQPESRNKKLLPLRTFQKWQRASPRALNPRPINTTQKSVELKQGICSSKPNAQQNLHVQKTLEIQINFRISPHPQHIQSITNALRQQALTSYPVPPSLVVSPVPSLQNMVTGSLENTLRTKRGDTQRKRKHATREKAGDLRVWIRSARLVVWRSELEFTKEKGVMQCRVGSRRCETKFPWVPPSSRCSPNLWSNGQG